MQQPTRRPGRPACSTGFVDRRPSVPNGRRRCRACSKVGRRREGWTGDGVTAPPVDSSISGGARQRTKHPKNNGEASDIDDRAEPDVNAC